MKHEPNPEREYPEPSPGEHLQEPPEEETYPYDPSGQSGEFMEE